MTRHSRMAGGRGSRLPLGVLAFVTLLTGCTDAAGYDLDYFMSRAPFVATMRTTVAYEPQTMPRLPAPGTVPVFSPMGEVIPEFTQAQLDSAAATLTNPLPVNEATLARGAVVYMNQCFVCHGAQGEGNGPVVGPGRFPIGPAIDSGPAVGQSDGYLYAVIRAGRGLMPSYGSRITHNDRWAVVHYVRQLQGQTVAAPAGAAVPAVPPPLPVLPGAEPAGPPVEEPAVPEPAASEAGAAEAVEPAAPGDQ